MAELTPEQQFRIEEFKTLRTEILTKLSDQKTLQRNVIVSLSVLYAVAATLDKYEISAGLKPLAWLIWWIPFGVAILGAASSYIDDRMIALAGQYIKKLEDDASWPGWQTYFDAQQRTAIGIWIHLPKFFWLAAVSMTFIIGVIETR
jgi:hypothetical protein